MLEGCWDAEAVAVARTERMLHARFDGAAGSGASCDSWAGGNGTQEGESYTGAPQSPHSPQRGAEGRSAVLGFIVIIGVCGGARAGWLVTICNRQLANLLAVRFGTNGSVVIVMVVVGRHGCHVSWCEVAEFRHVHPECRKAWGTGLAACWIALPLTTDASWYRALAARLPTVTVSVHHGLCVAHQQQRTGNARVRTSSACHSAERQRKTQS